MNENFAKIYWKILVKALRASPWIAAGLLIAIALLVLLVFEGRPLENKFLGLSIAVLLSVAGSLLAAALFWILHHIISLLEDSNTAVANEYFDKMHNQLGLLGIFEQRGELDAQSLYKSLIATATKRIWAIGMTNGSCINQNLDGILAQCQKRTNLDVRIFYWNPEALLSVDGGDPVPIFEAQDRLESKGGSGTDWYVKVHGSLDVVTKIILTKGQLKSPIHIHMLSLVTNISCFIIDDHVLFFPFLSNSGSNLDPHMHFTTEKGIGELIFKHYSHILTCEKSCKKHTYESTGPST